MAQDGLFANSGDKIDQIVESIKSYAKFEYYYIQNDCFKSKVNELYKTYLLRKYDETGKNRVLKKFNSIESDDTRLLAPIAVHNNYLEQAQTALKQCLGSTDSLTKSQLPKTNFGNLNTADLPDPNTPLISPFDRRLDRLVIDQSQGNNVYSVIPHSTVFAQAGTIGYTVSESYIQNSKVKGKDELIKKIKGDINRMQNDDFFVGVPSLMNNYAQIKLYGSKGGLYLINQKGKRKWYEVDQTIDGDLNISQIPSTSAIVSWGNGDPYGRTPYNFTDFVFCKNWKKVPNNRLITLRRFPAPIVDNLKFPGMDGTQADGNPADSDNSNGNTSRTNTNGDVIDQANEGTTDGGSSKKINFPPMATAVTYFGDETDNKLNDILKFTTGFEWEEVEADVHRVTASETPNDEQGPGSLWPGFTKLARQLNIAAGNWNQGAVMNQGQLPPDPYEDGPYENRIIGPVNRITKVKKRKAGIKFEMSGIELKFDYVARPIGGINVKAVLLDILSNFLIMGSTSAVFWGGQHRFMANPQRYPFLGGDKGIQQWYSGKPLEWGSTTIHNFLGKGQDIGSNIIQSAKNFFNSILGKGADKDLYGSLENVYSNEGITGNLVKAYAAEKSSGQIPYLQGLKALLIGEPVGEWHVTIGNPLNPIAMIGNLVCESIEVEFGNELGPDDFPLEMRVTVKLEHGMARDRDAIQSIFNRGMGRIYDLPDSFRGSAENETKVDNVTGENAPQTGRNPVYYRVPIATSGTTGGTFGTSKIVDNSMQGSVSVWNRQKYTSVSPNSELITRDSPLFRSSFRSIDWVALKSLK